MNPVAGGRVDASPHLGLDLCLGRALEQRGVDVADGHRAAPRDVHEPLELVDVELGIGLLVEVEGDGREPTCDQVLVDRVRRAADVGGEAHLLRLEVVDQLLVVRRDELPVVVGEIRLIDAVGSRRRARSSLHDGVAPPLAVVGGESHEVVDELRVLEGVEQHHLGIPHEHRDGPRPDRDGADRRRELGGDEALAQLEKSRQPRMLSRIGDLEARQRPLVLLEDVGLDRRHDVVRVLHAAAEGFRFFGEVVVG